MTTPNARLRPLRLLMREVVSFRKSSDSGQPAAWDLHASMVSFPCLIGCGRVLSSEGDHDTHVEKEHVEPPPRDLLCPASGCTTKGVFSSKGHRDRHVRSQHKHAQELKCLVCGHAPTNNRFVTNPPPPGPPPPPPSPAPHPYAPPPLPPPLPLPSITQTRLSEEAHENT